MKCLIMNDDRDEVTVDYSVENKGKTHILVMEFPEFVDEECFLISLAAYVKAQSRHLKDLEDGVLEN